MIPNVLIEVTVNISQDCQTEKNFTCFVFWNFSWINEQKLEAKRNNCKKKWLIDFSVSCHIKMQFSHSKGETFHR